MLKGTMMKPIAVAALLIAVILLLSVSVVLLLNKPKPSTPITYVQFTVEVVNSFPHDTNAFTEGLVYSGGFLYESTGLNGASSLRRENLTTGEVLQEAVLPGQYFGEGIAVVGDKMIQLTYTSQIGFVYDKASFALLGNFTYPTQGWGLTYDGKRLIMSDGSSTLTFLNPETYQKTGQVQVLGGNVSVANLNELEFVNGDVYANIFTQQKIAIINPETGQVKAWIDLSGLQGALDSDPEKVLNGIAYDGANERLFVTGKDWPLLYEIKLVPVK
jgi:glutaminyl-peptide cyclotransferase